MASINRNRIIPIIVALASAFGTACTTNTRDRHTKSAPGIDGAARSSSPQLDPKHLAHIGQAYYPKESLAIPEEGICLMSVTIESDGRVSASHLVQSSGFARLDSACESAFPGDVRFIPETKDGVAIKSTVTIPIVWCLGVGCRDRLAPSQASSTLCRMEIQGSKDSNIPAPAGSNLNVIRVTPTDGSTLFQDSVLEADLEYQVKDFKPGQFRILAQFALQQSGRSTDGDFPSSDYPVLASPTGRVHFCFPMAYVWQRPLELPLNVRFMLTRFDGDASLSSVVSQTQPLRFPATK